jgi:hypothetical protein
MHATRGRLVVLGLLSIAAFVAPAGAKPSPSNSEVPRVLTVVGRNVLGEADPLGEFRIVVRDLGNYPESGQIVTLDFSASTDLRLGTDQSPYGTLDCNSRVLSASAVTGANGVAVFRVTGRADHLLGSTSGALLRVFSDGVLLAFSGVSVAVLDQDGGGLGPGDLSEVLEDLFSSTNPARSDFDGNGVVGPADLSLWLAAFFAGGSIHEGSPTTCP